MHIPDIRGLQSLFQEPLGTMWGLYLGCFFWRLDGMSWFWQTCRRYFFVSGGVIRQLQMMWSLRRTMWNWRKTHAVLRFAASSWLLLFVNGLRLLRQGQFHPFREWWGAVGLRVSAPEGATYKLVNVSWLWPRAFPASLPSPEPTSPSSAHNQSILVRLCNVTLLNTPML